MDFSFAPGRTGQDRRVRHLFIRRSNTMLVPRARRRSTVRQFIQHLENNGGVTRPIDDMLIGAHANAQGFLFIPMYPGQRGATQFETLEHTISTPAASVEVADVVIGHTADASITHGFHIKGCNIGKARPFLVKLKEALGNTVNVSAPKHIHIIYDIRRLGTIEGMMYEFTHKQPAPVTSRADLLALFQGNAAFVKYDDSPITNNEWDQWLPRRIRRNHLRRHRTMRTRMNVPLGQQLGNRRTVPVRLELRIRLTPFTYTITFPNAGSVPGNQADRQQALNNSINAQASFDSAHEYPMYERWGYTSSANFLQGFTWRFRRRGARLICTGRRYDYTLRPPIVDSTGNFIFNFYPRTGSTVPAVNTGLVETDSDFFEMV